MSKKLTDIEKEIMFEFSIGGTIAEIMAKYDLKKNKVEKLKVLYDYGYKEPHLSLQCSNKDSKNIMLFSDPHIPFHHPDMFPFLEAMKDKYQPDEVICMGDEVDNHYLNFHTKEGKILNPTGEREQAKKYLKTMQELFPDMVLVHSNHGDLPDRKAAISGLHPDDIKSRHDRLEITANWKWYENYTFTLPNGSEVYCTHDYKAGILSAAKDVGMSLIQGHFHTRYALEFWSTPKYLNFALQLPCLIDTHSPAFKYISKFKGRILVGGAVIENNIPRLVPLVKDKHGRWTGELI